MGWQQCHSVHIQHSTIVSAVITGCCSHYSQSRADIIGELAGRATLGHMSRQGTPWDTVGHNKCTDGFTLQHHRPNKYPHINISGSYIHWYHCPMLWCASYRLHLWVLSEWIFLGQRVEVCMGCPSPVAPWAVSEPVTTDLTAVHDPVCQASAQISPLISGVPARLLYLNTCPIFSSLQILGLNQTSAQKKAKNHMKHFINLDQTSHAASFRSK